MEFEGKIKRVLEVRTGVSQRTGNEWKALPVVFYFYEPGNTQTEKSVMLEIFDTNIQAQIARHLAKGQDGKAVIVDGEYRMNVQEIPAKADFSPFFRMGTRTDGKRYAANDIRMYKLEIVTGQAQQPVAAQAIPQAQVPFPPQQPIGGQDNDDLPF